MQTKLEGMHNLKGKQKCNKKVCVVLETLHHKVQGHGGRVKFLISHKDTQLGRNRTAKYEVNSKEEAVNSKEEYPSVSD